MSKSVFNTLQDAAQASETAYDSLWTGADVPTQAPTALEQVMLADDKIFVVLAVVLIIWAGIIVFLLRTDRHLQSVERSVESPIGADAVEL